MKIQGVLKALRERLVQLERDELSQVKLPSETVSAKVGLCGTEAES